MMYLGFQGVDATIPQVDFAKVAQGMGADGIRIEREYDIQAALEKAMTSPSPFVVDVLIESTSPAPIGNRLDSLIWQGATNY